MRKESSGLRIRAGSEERHRSRRDRAAHQFQGIIDGAGSGNRTRVFSLEGCCSTIELYPREVLIRATEWWRELDLNQRRLSQRIYSPSPLTTRASLHIPAGSSDQYRPFGCALRRRLRSGAVYDGHNSSCQHDVTEKIAKNVVIPMPEPKRRHSLAARFFAACAKPLHTFARHAL